MLGVLFDRWVAAVGRARARAIVAATHATAATRRRAYRELWLIVAYLREHRAGAIEDAKPYAVSIRLRMHFTRMRRGCRRRREDRDALNETAIAMDARSRRDRAFQRWRLHAATRVHRRLLRLRAEHHRKRKSLFAWRAWSALAAEVRRVLSHTGPHTTASASCSPILKDFFLSRRGSPPRVPRWFQSPPLTPFNSASDAFRLERSFRDLTPSPPSRDPPPGASQGLHSKARVRHAQDGQVQQAHGDRAPEGASRGVDAFARLGRNGMWECENSFSRSRS